MCGHARVCVHSLGELQLVLTPVQFGLYIVPDRRRDRRVECQCVMPLSFTD